MGRTVLFIGGSGSDRRSFENVLDALEERGHATSFVGIKWQTGEPIRSWLATVREAYAGYAPGEVILAGFSFGAYLALIVAAEKPPAQLMLMSQSPYYAEDLKRVHEEWRTMIEKRYPGFLEAASQTPFPDVSRLTCPVSIFYGEGETDGNGIMGRRAADTYDSVRLVSTGATLACVPGAGHGLTATYMRMVLEAIV